MAERALETLLRRERLIVWSALAILTLLAWLWVFVGAGTVGAVAAAATLLPGAVQQTAATPETKEPPARGGGYQLTEHVKQYYRTTLV